MSHRKNKISFANRITRTLRKNKKNEINCIEKKTVADIEMIETC